MSVRSGAGQAATSKAGRVRIKVDHGAGLQADDPLIRRDAEILYKLRDAVYRQIKSTTSRTRLQDRPTLYNRYRGTGFPLTYRGKRLPAWKNLTPWMKAQVGTLVMSESGWMPFMVRPHDDTWDRWGRKRLNRKDELRNLISLHLKKRLGYAPHFYFVIEDRDTGGGQTRPHAHGSIGLVRAPIPTTGEGSRKLRKMAEVEGEVQAQIEAGRLVIKEALKAAAGAHLPRTAVTSGVNQARNFWVREKPYHAIFNHQYIDYAFRNMKRVSETLGDNRFAMTNPLRGEAKRLWNLIRDGEPALEQWPS